MSIFVGGPVETLQRMRMSYDEYLAIPPEIHAEWVDGEVVVSPTATYDHNSIAQRLIFAFARDLPTTRQVGDTTIYLPNNRERRPDVLVLKDRPQGDYPVVADDGSPVILVEVNSPSTRSEDWIRKTQDYLAAGTGQYWLVDPQAHTLTVLQNVDGEWQEALRLDETQRTGEVTVGEYGTVAIDLDELLAP